MRLLAIDPGPVQSGWVIIDDDLRPVEFGKTANDELLLDVLYVRKFSAARIDRAVLEQVASYGMPVGEDVFETCVWTGRFMEALAPLPVTRHKRLAVKLHHCHSARATDATIRQALVDRFAPGQPNHGKGTKAAPGWFHGFAADVWAAYALAVYAADTMKEK